ncbi:hypothetical protein AAFF_G00015090 [Aldrovandia affinis]|uniref:Uncharacterized protein n=1 Tax=Aldrovandia affinis TaxID=143900 RepID=A0AAD7WGX2_9TELE|nr:hypothetical protein AAFF_G00015090 [Aldrovandia affinis]
MTDALELSYARSEESTQRTCDVIHGAPKEPQKTPQSRSGQQWHQQHPLPAPPCTVGTAASQVMVPPSRPTHSVSESWGRSSRGAAALSGAMLSGAGGVPSEANASVVMTTEMSEGVHPPRY